jgi:hypothetical protein
VLEGYKSFMGEFLGDTFTIEPPSAYLTEAEDQDRGPAKDLFRPEDLVERMNQATENSLQQIQGNY